MKYLSKKSNKWMYRILLFILSIWLFIELIQVYNYIKMSGSLTFVGLILPILLCTFIINLNTVSYDDSNIYITNYKGIETFPRIDFEKIIPVISFLNFHWIYIKFDKKYLFYVGNMNIMGSVDSEEVANQMTNEVRLK